MSKWMSHCRKRRLTRRSWLIEEEAEVIVLQEENEQEGAEI